MNLPQDALLCPITLQIFQDPVLAEDGHTYEKKAILDWIKRRGTSPLTGANLSTERLYPNYAIKKAVQSFEETAKAKKYKYILGVDIKKPRNYFKLSGNLFIVHSG